MSNAASPPQEYVDEPAAEAPAEEVETDRYAKLKEAKELLDAGILTEEEFAAEKKKILG